MNNPTKPVSPILPTDTAVESGHVVPGLAGGDEEADLGVAGAGGGEAGPAEHQEGGEEEVLPQAARASPEQPTASQVADHELTHLHYRAWCPDCCEIFGRERAHYVLDPSGRRLPLIAIDYCFLTERGLQMKSEVDFG